MTSVYWTLWIVGMGVGITLTGVSLAFSSRAHRAGRAGEHAYQRYFDAVGRADDMAAAEGHIAIAHRMSDTCRADFAVARRIGKLGCWMTGLACAVTWGRVALAWLL